METLERDTEIAIKQMVTTGAVYQLTRSRIGNILFDVIEPNDYCVVDVEDEND